MPLSEHEQKMLDEMERQLFADDPRLARAFAPQRRRPSSRRSGRRILLGLGIVVVGLGVLVLAVSLPAVWLGVLAFLGMLGGAVLAVTTPSSRAEDADSADGGDGGGGPEIPPAPGGDSGSFMRRMEERWEKRADEDGRV